MIMQDKLEKERCDAKNSVEEYVYEMRDKLFGELEPFIKEEVCTGWQQCLIHVNHISIYLKVLQG